MEDSNYLELLWRLVADMDLLLGLPKVEGI